MYIEESTHDPDEKRIEIFNIEYGRRHVSLAFFLFHTSNRLGVSVGRRSKRYTVMKYPSRCYNGMNQPRPDRLELSSGISPEDAHLSSFSIKQTKTNAEVTKNSIIYYTFLFQFENPTDF
jgi:hypothetical protein